MSTLAQPRLLFVHAHPDDETLATGVTLAHYARTGADVHVLTCTLGDEGEVIPTELAHLVSTADDTLGAFRRHELRAAMAELAVTEHVLGEDPATRTGATFRDSGMAGTDENNDPRAWCRAPIARSAGVISEFLTTLRPDAVITYDAHGGYGHPDHIRVHEATLAAVAQLPPTARPPVFVTLIPLDVAQAGRTWLHEHVPTDSPTHVPAPQDPFAPSVVDPALVTHAVVGSAQDLTRRDAALRHHRTQVSVYEGYYALSNDIAIPLARVEYFAQVDPVSGALLPAPDGAARGADGRVEGLLAAPGA